MCQASLLSAVPESLERLPAWGTTSNGLLYELPTPVRLTDARDGSASLPTPRSFMANMADRPLKLRQNMGDHRGPNLEEVIALLPTPVVNDMGAGKSVEKWDSWTDEMKAKHGNGNGHGPSLSIEVARLLPTPTAQAAKHGSTPDIHANGFGSNLWDIPHLLPTPQALDSKIFGPNVDWKKRAENHADSVASVLMNLPLNDGNESSDDPHLTQQTIEDCDPDSSNG